MKRQMWACGRASRQWWRNGHSHIALRLGKVVGEPTAGWIVYTWNVRLLDGSSLRVPRTRITTDQGADTKMHPRPADVPVTRPIGESYAGKDSQPDAAVTEPLSQIGANK